MLVAADVVDVLLGEVGDDVEADELEGGAADTAEEDAGER